MSIKADNFDFKRILSGPAAKNKFTIDLMDAANHVIGKEVEEKRRLLERSRDSVRARKGDIISHIEYRPEPDKLAYSDDTGEILDLPFGIIIPKGRVRRFITNTGAYNEAPQIDYFDIEFFWEKRKYRWLLPQNVTQERSLLIKNSYLLGFDFFSNNLTDEDYARLYENLSQYWDESGLDDFFIKFIGFVKNIRLDLEPLWSKDDGTDRITVLEPFNGSEMVKASEGGDWYLTSHVQITYDLRQFNEFYSLNIHDLETLFYCFAPIMLVLEKIIGSLQEEIDIGILTVSDLVQYDHGIKKPKTEFEISQNSFGVTDVHSIDYSYNEVQTDFELIKGYNAASDVVRYDFKDYDIINPDHNFEKGLRFAFTHIPSIQLFNHAIYDSKVITTPHLYSNNVTIVTQNSYAILNQSLQ